MGKAPARLLPLQHLQMKAMKREDDNDPDHGLEKISRNRMKLYSYFKPSLQAGTYSIYAEQNIQLTDTEGKKNLTDAKGKPQSLRVWNRKVEPPNPDTTPPPTPEPQVFEVVAPQFSLDPKLINSYYPPDGHQDEARILPHVCFNDPHLPWERDPGKFVYGRRDPEPLSDPKTYRSMVPWLALIVFDPDELRLNTVDEAQKLKIPGFEDASKVDMNKQQNANGTFSMNIGDYVTKITSRIKYQVGYQKPTGEISDQQGWDEIRTSPDPMTAIFPKKALFQRIFENPDYDAAAAAKDTESDPFDGQPRDYGRPDNIEGHKYLAHVRHINTTGCPDAGIDQEGLFSVIISGRSGAIGIKQPTPQVCHLVSIEHVDSTYSDVHKWLAKPVDGDSDRIGMVSLFSWVYMGLPPNPINFVDTMRDVLTKRQLLRPGRDVLQNLANAASAPNPGKDAKIARQLLSRFTLGYTISRWRTETGEEVAAFNRGPLVPQPTTRPGGFPESSNTSKEFQIVDSGTGLVDLSYSSAWQLGKLLAISDTTFNAALMRFRSLVYNLAADTAQKEENDMQDPPKVIASLAANLPQLANMSAGVVGAPRRLASGAQADLPPRLDDPNMKKRVTIAIREEVTRLSRAGDKIFNDLGLAKPNNNDWVIIHNWIFEKMYFSDIPAHYLIPDPSFLPVESMRFFHIDDTWLDCLIDGALSVANHLDRDDDRVRSAIKITLNTYLKTEVEGIVPQIPSCGFILRSQIVKVMPDMKMTVTWKKKDDKGHERHEVCRYTRLDDQTIMGLFDRQFEELDAIVFAQPPHQQNFSLGFSLVPNPKHLGVQLKHLYTTDPAPDGTWDPLTSFQPDDKATGQWYNFSPDSRMVYPMRMATDINKILNDDKNQPDKPFAYKDVIPNSCELAMELNNPSYFFRIEPEIQKEERVPRGREIYVGPLTDPPESDQSTDDGGVTGNTDDQPSGTKDAPGGPPKNTVPPDPIPAKWVPTRMSTKELPMAQATDADTLSSLQLETRFVLSIYPDFKGPPIPFDPDAQVFDPDDFVPTQDEYLFDLNFIIRKIDSVSNSTYSLKEILVEIPHEGIYSSSDPTERDTEALIEEDYDGPGARMLGNQHFVPFLNRNSKVLSVRLVPRSADDNPVIPINDVRTTEVSFRLAEPRIANIKMPPTPVAIRGAKKKLDRGFVTVQMYERYETPSGDAYVNTEWFVVKKDNTKEDPK